MIKIKSIKKVSSPIGVGTSKKKDIQHLPKYNMGSTMANIGHGFGIDSKKKWSDFTGGEKAGTIGASGMSVAGAGSSLAGGVVSAFDKNKNRFDKNDAASSMLTGVGSGVASGASAGAMFGPWGAAIGGAVGGIAGAIGAGNANKEAYKQQQTDDRILSISNAQNSMANVGINTTVKKNKNLGIPGFNKGVYKFYSNKDNQPNAMVASEEAIVHPSGFVDIVPGKYNESNPDTTIASIEDGSSILPKDKYFKLPDGKSTPADIAKRVSKIQSKANDVLGKRNASFIARNTHELNLKNADEVIDSVSMYAESMRNMQSKNNNMQKYGKYANGVSSFSGINELREFTVTANRANKLKNPIPNDMIKYPVGTGASRRMQSSTSDQFINTFKGEFDNELLNLNNDSTAAYNKLVEKYGAQKIGSYSRSLPRFNEGEEDFDGEYQSSKSTKRKVRNYMNMSDRDMLIYSKNRLNNAILKDKQKYPPAKKMVDENGDQYSIINVDGENVMAYPGRSYVPYTNPGKKSTPGGEWTSQNEGGESKFIFSDFINDIGSIIADDNLRNTVKDNIQKQESSADNAKNAVYKKRSSIFDGFKNNATANGLLKSATLASAVGSSLSQYYNAVPETVSPEVYTPTEYKYRSNLFNQLKDIQAKENIARYNNRVIGSNATSASALNAILNRNTNNAFAAAYDADNRNRLNIEDLNAKEKSRVKGLNTQEKIRAKGINMRNAAAARNIKYAAIQDIAKTLYPRQYNPYDKYQQ